MIGWLLDYTSQIRLTVPDGEADRLCTGSFYKLSLRRYLPSREGDTLVGKPALTYLDFKRIIQLCTRECEKRGIPLQVSHALRQYIDSRENFLDQRRKLGIEIQNRDPKLEGTFQAYKAVVDGAMVRPLRERQMWDSFFMCSMRRSANFSVPGSGKTASVLGMYAHLRRSGLARRILVVCPKNAFGSWMDEFALSFGGRDPLRVLDLQDSRYSNAAARRTARRYDAGDANLILVNYELAGSVLEDLTELVQRDTLLLILGLSFLVQGKTALVPIGIIWAVLGLWKTTDAFVDFWEAYQAKQGVLSALAELLIRLILSLLLLFDPYGKFTPHIAILGATLLLNAIFPERR